MQHLTQEDTLGATVQNQQERAKQQNFRASMPYNTRSAMCQTQASKQSIYSLLKPCKVAGEMNKPCSQGILSTRATSVRHLYKTKLSHNGRLQISECVAIAASNLQCTLVQIAGTAQAVGVQTGPCPAIHSNWKIAADAEVSFVASSSAVKLPSLRLSLLHQSSKVRQGQ